jgi:ABC-2 type transport system ATP-binding protein
MDMLSKINKNGTTIIIASQLLTELEKFCDRICIINNGKIVKEGTLDEIRKEHTPLTEIHLELLSGNYEKILESLQKKIRLNEIKDEGRNLILYTTNAEKTLHNLLQIIEKNKETILTINLNKPSLSDVFEFLVKK